MNLEAVGNIAELISAIGVVATLGYLAVQIRQSSITTRANIRQLLAGQQIDHVRHIVNEPNLRAVMAKAAVGEPLTTDDSQVYGNFAIAGLRLFESCHAQWEYGVLPEEDWTAVRARYATALHAKEFALEFLRRPDTFNPRFAALVTSIIEKSGGA
jgi:hypothetical protein